MSEYSKLIIIDESTTAPSWYNFHNKQRRHLASVPVLHVTLYTVLETTAQSGSRDYRLALFPGLGTRLARNDAHVTFDHVQSAGGNSAVFWISAASLVPQIV